MHAPHPSTTALTRSEGPTVTRSAPSARRQAPSCVLRPVASCCIRLHPGRIGLLCVALLQHPRHLHLRPPDSLQTMKSKTLATQCLIPASARIPATNPPQQTPRNKLAATNAPQQPLCNNPSVPPHLPPVNRKSKIENRKSLQSPFLKLPPLLRLPWPR
jgi:hypothetical protein